MWGFGRIYERFRGHGTEWHERRYVETACAKALAVHRAVLAEDPSLEGHLLYERIVLQLTGGDHEKARAFVRRAEESFTIWPIERDLMFRDVVEYLIISEYFESSNNVAGMRTDVNALVKSLVPEEL